jgi:hypothetical protein
MLRAFELGFHSDLLQMLRCYAPLNWVFIPICYKYCGATHLF